MKYHYTHATEEETEVHQQSEVTCPRLYTTGEADSGSDPGPLSLIRTLSTEPQLLLKGRA